MPIVATVGGNWADLLDPIVRFQADQAFSRRASLIDALFNVQGSTRAYEDISGVGAIGIDAWGEYAATGRIPEVDFDQGYKKRYTHTIYTLDLGFDQATYADAQGQSNAQVLKFAQRIADSAAVKREVDAASVFNNAFSASFTGGDSVALCSASHPYSPSKPGTVQSNTGVLPLTIDNVETTRQAMMAFTDDNGNKQAVTPDMLIVPPALENQAIVITKSLLDPSSANNAVNPQAGRWKAPLVWHYLTDSNNWFMVDSMLMKQCLDWFNRIPFSVFLRAGDDTTVKAYWRSYMRYSFGFSDWKWVYGHNVP